MARNPKVELRGHEGQVVHPITDGDCVIFPSGETLSHKLSEQEEVMYAPEVTNSSPMFKVGEGDSADYSANVLDGAYQEAVLKGQTYVNTIQEPSADVITLPTPFTEYERTQSKTFTEMQDGTFGLNLVGQSYVNCIQEPSEPSYVALGENLEFQNKKVEYTNEGQIKSAMLKGQTLVNLWNNNGEYNIAPSTLIEQKGNCFKKSTKYLLKYNILQSNTKNLLVIQYYQDGQWVVNESIDADTNKGYYILNTPSVDFNKIRLFYHSSFGTETVILKEIMIIEYIEGMENWDIPYFEGMQSVTMTTELENVCSRYNSSGAKNGKTFTVGTASARYLELATSTNINSYNFKPNTKYLMQFKISNLNMDGLESLTLVFSNGSISQGNALFGDNSQVMINKNGVYRAILTTSNIISTSDFIVKGTITQWEDTTSTTRKLTISQIMCIEYQNGMENWDLPYFETTQLMKPLKVQSVNKNIVNLGTFTSQTKNGITLSSLDSSSIKLDGSNTTNDYTNFWLNSLYMKFKTGTYSYNFNYASDYVTYFFKDGNGNNIISTKRQNGTITINNDVEITQALIQISNGFSISNQTITLQIEESDTPTSYVPHQSKITSALEPITLRAIGNVKDTLDLSTGEYVQRIGEIVLDGSDDEKWVLYPRDNYSEWTTYQWRYTLPFASSGFAYAHEVTKTMCDKLKYGSLGNDIEEDYEHYRSNGQNANGISEYIYIWLSQSKASTTEELKTYLASNPIKVQYILANPITRKISLEYPNIQTYTDITHVQSIAMDGTLIPKIFLPSDISYKAMLKPNTSYNVIVDRKVIDSTNQLTINLGGTTANITANRTVVTTPSTLSNETLTFSGKDNRLAKAMLIEGSTLINGDLPHFDGIGDVKLGRVVENLCLSNEYADGNGRTTDTYSNNSITSKFTASGSRVYLFDLIKPVQNGKKYFVYAPCSQTCAIGFKTIYNGASLFSVARTNIDNYTILSIDNEILRECKLFIGQLGAMPVNTTMTIRRPILCEYIDGMENWDWESIGYFTGARNIGNEFMRIRNKNLFDWNSYKDKIKNESCFTILDNGFKADCSKGAVGNFLRDKYRFAEGIFKENTQYTISFDTTHEGNLYLSPFVAYTDGTYEGIAIGGNGKRTLTTAINKTVKLFSVTWSTQTNSGKSTLTNIQLEEASSATSYVAHKHNSLHILPNEQIPLTFEQGAINYAKGDTWANAINNTYNIRIRTQLLNLEPNETYRISCGNNGYNFAVYSYDNSSLGTSGTGWLGGEYYISATKDINKIAITIRKPDDANITPSVLHQVRLEKVTDVTLRGFGGVRDELDLTRGVYIQRIKEIILNGKEQWKLCTLAYQPTDTNYINYDLEIDNIKLSAPILCDSIKTRDWNISSIEFNSRSIAGHSTNRILRLCIEKSIAPDVETLKTYLSTNMVKVQYQLRTPIEHKINIPMKNESNQTIAKPNGVFTLPLMYSETNHVDINSQIYPKVQSRDYISYPVIANNSQLHTVFHNKVGTGNLTVNLCGTSVTSVDGTSKCTITTPSSISQYELRLSGARNKVSNVCVFSGDYMNVNVPYVQGMMNAVNPIVKNVGKNLLPNNNFYEKMFSQDKDGVRIINQSNRAWCLMFHNNIAIPLRRGTYIYTSQLVRGTFNGGVTKFIFSDGTEAGEFWNYNNGQKSTHKIVLEKDKVLTGVYMWNPTGDFVIQLQLEEASTPSQYEPYKENNCEPECGEIKLTEDIMALGTINDSSVGTYYELALTNSDVRIRTKEPIKVKPNTTYARKLPSDYTGWVVTYDSEMRYTGKTFWDETFTTPINVHYIIPVFRKVSNASMSLSEWDKLHIFELSEVITLRSLPNGVRDELNLQTGEYIQRIGEVVLDGSDDEDWYYTDTDTSDSGAPRFSTKIIDRKYYSNNIIVCDKYKVVSFSNLWNGTEDNCIGAWGSGVHINVRDTQYTSVADFKTSLQQNPIKVQYELATPIIKHINIHNYPHSYKDGHIIIESNDPSTNVTAQITYQCVANRTGQIQEHTEQIEKQEHEINELEMLILENIRQQQNR